MTRRITTRRSGGIARRSRLRADDRGSATAWLLLILPVIMAAAGLVVDGGRALAARQEATGLAGEAARAAVDRMDASAYRAGGGVQAPGSAQAAACSWVAATRPEATCEAQPGSAGEVAVSVSVVYQPVLLSALGVEAMTATGRGTARPAVGVQEEVSGP